MRFQAPKGTRDFYPPEMAWHRYLLDRWRGVAIRNGFEEVEGPIFEPLDLYKVKSGEGIVNELFHFQDRGERELAIRPEFTPTLARMVAERASALTKPIKWFCTPNLCRAERPQRGRLREFWQWNIDILGSADAVADAECIFTVVDLLADLGLQPHHVHVKISHRVTVRHILAKLGVPEDQMLAAFDLLDRRDKVTPEEFTRGAAALGLDPDRVTRFDEICRRKYPCGDLDHLRRSIGMTDNLGDLEALDDQLQAFGLVEWCEYDLGIVRGLAYYTGVVFEVHERSGALRALAGGGRYDQLIQLFHGPATPAVGCGMGDVVLTDVLRDKGLLPADVAPKPDAFVFAATDAAAPLVPTVVAMLRRAGRHARFTYKSTRNVGKLLKDASACGARYAVILDDHAPEGHAALKSLTTGDQREVPLATLATQLT